MSDKTKKPVAPQQTGNSRDQQHRRSRSNNSKKIRKGTKLHSVISHLVAGNRLHRFQAEKICHDHVLPSTIAAFQREYGLEVAREYVTVSAYNNSTVIVAEYWLPESERKKAAKLLEVV